MAVEANACAKELTATLKKRMLLHKEEAAECIQMLRKLGEPVEALQVGTGSVLCLLVVEGRHRHCLEGMALCLASAVMSRDETVLGKESRKNVPQLVSNADAGHLANRCRPKVAFLHCTRARHHAFAVLRRRNFCPA